MFIGCEIVGKTPLGRVSWLDSLRVVHVDEADVTRPQREREC